MKKTILVILTLITVILSCEKDDFCVTNPVTPNLVILFYDANEDDEPLEVDSLYVWAEGKDSIYDFDETNTTIDSIAIPLNTESTSTTYYFAQGLEKIDTLTVEYTTEDEYVSRSCGFKVIFNDVVITKENTESWIQFIDPEDIETIDNQEEAHVKIYH